MTELRIDADRLYRSLRDLGQIGAFDDPVSGLSGVCRLALSDEDGAGRRLVRGWFEEAGLDVRVDQIGNVFAQRAGLKSMAPPVMTGSHADSVPTGGRFDGALGVLAGLEVVRTLNDHGAETRRPLVVAICTEEEGCRFGTDMLGSAVATGRIPLEQAYGCTDRDGKTVRGELDRIGFLGEETAGARKPHAFVECHIEQGPLLIRGGRDIGVVTGVQGISWFEVAITGRSAHAGTTPTDIRSDAGLVAALLNVHLRDMAQSSEFGEMRGTVGVMQPYPGAINVIPGRMRITVDLRNPDDELMARAEEEIRSHSDALAAEHDVEVEWRQTAKTDAVDFDASVQQIIEDTANRFGLSNTRLIAGAGHDAQEWAAVCKTAMVFVPGEHDGISHNPRELSTNKQCADGANVLLHTMLQLADES